MVDGVAANFSACIRLIQILNYLSFPTYFTFELSKCILTRADRFEYLALFAPEFRAEHKLKLTLSALEFIFLLQ
jgi:hypothetical protein